MMSYELFKAVVMKRLKEFLPEEYAEYTVKISKLHKVNQSLDCINLIPPGDECAVLPNIYVEEMYEEFQKHQDLNHILKKTAASIVYTYTKVKQPPERIDFSQWKDQIVINLVNTAENEELLRELPHRPFPDLSLIYRFIMSRTENDLATVRVNYGLAREIGMTEEELYETALKNTIRMFPVVTETVEDMKLLPEGDFSKMVRDGSTIGKKDIVNSIQFLSNSVHVQGAACMLYEDELYQTARKMGSSFYVIPSSVHEIIAIAQRYADPEYLQNLLREANTKDFVGVEKLSDRLYFYDMDKRSLAFAFPEEQMGIQTGNIQTVGRGAEPGRA